MPNITINYSDNQNKHDVNEECITSSAIKMMEHVLQRSDVINKSALSDCDLENLEIHFDLLMCDDEFIHELNREYRGKDRPTDVLSFALFADDQDEKTILDNTIELGEIIISTETAKAQADDDNKPFEHEILFLISHGILHLLGFDHLDEDSLQFMLSTQEEMINSL